MSRDSQLRQAVGGLDRKPGMTRVRVGVKSSADPLHGTTDGHVAGIAVIQTKGATAVADAAAVQRPSRARCRDDAIAATAAECVAWAGVSSADTVKVGTEDGWITLTGQVEWNYQRDLAEQSVGWISGVVGVSNQITIKPPVDGSNIGEELTDALDRSWFCDPAGILVATDAGKVQLSGTVRSPLHRRVAASWPGPYAA